MHFHKLLLLKKFIWSYPKDFGLYGLKEATLSWFEHLKGHLEQQGFGASKIDQCVYQLKTNGLSSHLH